MPSPVLLKTRDRPTPYWSPRPAAERLAARADGLEAPVSGTVYGVVLNVRGQVERYAPAMNAAPYQAPPRAPVLYIKTPNTYRPHGATVTIPAGIAALEVKPTLAVVMGAGFGRVAEADALTKVAGYTIALDVCIPHDSLYRPAIRQRCGDGFLPIGPWIAPPDALDPDAAAVGLAVNGAAQPGFSTTELVRPVARLIAEIAAFSSFFAGDVLLVGLPADGALVGDGDAVTATIDGIGALSCRFAAEAA